MLIKDIPTYLRPSEKAQREGIETLSDVELLSIILRTGSRGEDVLKLSKNILEKFKTFNLLFNSPISEIIKIKGIGKIRAIQIKALGEIYVRFWDRKIEIISNEKDIINIAFKHIGLSEREQMFIMFLNFKNEIIFNQVFYQGTEDRIAIEPREIISLALINKAKKIICVHNHPSGNTSPSNADILTSKQINYLANIFNFKSIKHFIINKNGDYTNINIDFML